MIVHCWQQPHSSTCIVPQFVCRYSGIALIYLPLPLPLLFLAVLQLGERTLTPTSRSVNLEESRSCFMSSLSEYAANKVRGHYGDHLRRSTASLASLAGY
jgi:hypothetical protein